VHEYKIGRSSIGTEGLAAVAMVRRRDNDNSFLDSESGMVIRVAEFWVLRTDIWFASTKAMFAIRVHVVLHSWISFNYLLSLRWPPSTESYPSERWRNSALDPGTARISGQEFSMTMDWA